MKSMPEAIRENRAMIRRERLRLRVMETSGYTELDREIEGIGSWQTEYVNEVIFWMRPLSMREDSQPSRPAKNMVIVETCCIITRSSK